MTLIETLNLLTKPTPYQSRAPKLELREGRYALRFAQTAMDLDAVLKLRFEVFNLELGEGLQSSFLTGRDRDEFDAQCHHLMVEDTEAGNVVGTYRLQTNEMAAAGNGFYSAGEFDLSHLPDDVVLNSIELGRACIAPAHRHTSVLFLLWRGIAAYTLQQRKRYLFGCCSLTSQNPLEGWEVMNQLQLGGHVHANWLVLPQLGFECDIEDDDELLVEAKIPKLFRSYLRFGARVCSPPTMDRQFKTIDYFVILDCHQLSSTAYQMFFQ
ncbi:MAG TPA: GNAT family N-acyltransferase [Blastocatellia bacterium]|nr:GNAT family N-acyltransferase [Blastocatellia bacterium]